MKEKKSTRFGRLDEVDNIDISLKGIGAPYGGIIEENESRFSDEDRNDDDDDFGSQR